MATEPGMPIRAGWLATGALVAPLILAAAEATVPGGVGWFEALPATVRATFIGCGPAVGLVGILAFPTLQLNVRPHAAIALQVLVAAALSGLLLVGLRADSAIVAHPGVIVALGAIPLAFGLEIWARSKRPWTSWVVGFTAFAGGFGTWLTNYRFAPGTYPEAHWALTVITFVLCGVGFAHLALAAACRAPAGRPRLLLVVSGVSLAGCLLLGFNSNATSRAHIAADTEVGRAALLVAGEEAHESVRLTPTVGTGAAMHEARPFDLPADFRLEDWDILFVATEAVRWDDTSLHAPELDTTPNLVRWRDAGAMEFKHAYSPSSGTLQSLASWFTMRPPSCTELDLYKPHWAGRLRDDATTVAEVMSDLGRHTFWVGHDFRGLWSTKLFGFEQGFAHVERTPEPNRKVSLLADDKTGDALVRKIRDLKKDQRWFGFVMFSSPHFSYVKHYPDMPAKTPRQRYRQELRKADEQLGKLFDVLKETGRLERTIVILTADHGEEFKDHGATGHNRTVYDESVRVPLLVWLPGATPLRTELPTSTGWLLPWLLLHGDEELVGRTHGLLLDGWGPMLASTDGAVVVELLRGERSQTALINGSEKLVLDLAAQRAIALDLKADPKEMTKVFVLTEEQKNRVVGYRSARRGCERFKDTKVRPPKPPKETSTKR